MLTRLCSLEAEFLVFAEQLYCFAQTLHPGLFSLRPGDPDHILTLVRWRKFLKVFPGLRLFPERLLHVIRHGNYFGNRRTRSRRSTFMPDFRKPDLRHASFPNQLRDTALVQIRPVPVVTARSELA